MIFNFFENLFKNIDSFCAKIVVLFASLKEKYQEKKGQNKLLKCIKFCQNFWLSPNEFSLRISKYALIRFKRIVYVINAILDYDNDWYIDNDDAKFKSAKFWREFPEFLLWAFMLPFFIIGDFLYISIYRTVRLFQGKWVHTLLTKVFKNFSIFLKSDWKFFKKVYDYAFYGKLPEKEEQAENSTEDLQEERDVVDLPEEEDQDFSVEEENVDLPEEDLDFAKEEDKNNDKRS